MKSMLRLLCSVVALLVVVSLVAAGKKVAEEKKECPRACANNAKECGKSADTKGCCKAAVAKQCSECTDAKQCVVNCPVSGKPASADVTADYKGGKVSFCCGGCCAKFTKDSSKFATKANHQLVATKQAVQCGCPISGGKLNPDTALKVCGVDITFCCNGCKGKVAKAEGDAQAKMVFGDKAFKKGFKIAKKGDE